MYQNYYYAEAVPPMDGTPISNRPPTVEDNQMKQSTNTGTTKWGSTPLASEKNNAKYAYLPKIRRAENDFEGTAYNRGNARARRYSIALSDERAEKQDPTENARALRNDVQQSSARTWGGAGNPLASMHMTLRVHVHRHPSSPAHADLVPERKRARETLACGTRTQSSSDAARRECVAIAQTTPRFHPSLLPIRLPRMRTSSRKGSAGGAGSSQHGHDAAQRIPLDRPPTLRSDEPRSARACFGRGIVARVYVPTPGTTGKEGGRREGRLPRARARGEEADAVGGPDPKVPDPERAAGMQSSWAGKKRGKEAVPVAGSILRDDDSGQPASAAQLFHFCARAYRPLSGCSESSDRYGPACCKAESPRKMAVDDGDRSRYKMSASTKATYRCRYRLSHEGTCDIET
ncbi:hypothetical protein B0H13DRAFT_2278459 [Mycena leptocephala]|nr:hypothetical protein B0H13DRAFT_2278459 [Mycena leptocephala]